MLERERLNVEVAEMIISQNEVFNIEEFVSITEEDLAAVGKLYPVGSKHFINNNNMLQNLQTITASPMWAEVSPHFSKVKLAKVLEEVLNIEDLGLVFENIGVVEGVETQRIAQTGAKMLEEEYVQDPMEDMDAAIAEDPSSQQAV